MSIIAHRAARSRYVGLVGLVVMGCVMVAGCGPSLELIPVHGQVLYQGKPLVYGSVMFQPEGDGPLARAKIESDGTFVLRTGTDADGVRPGTCRVRITSFEAQQSEPATRGQGELALGRSAIPKKYQHFGTSGIVVEVVPSMNLPLVIELN